MDMTVPSFYSRSQKELWNLNMAAPSSCSIGDNALFSIWQTSPDPSPSPYPNHNHAFDELWSLPVEEASGGYGFDTWNCGTTATLDNMGFNDALFRPTSMKIVQVNGQRVYGPPSGYFGPTPPRGAEVFVGALPPDCFEQELIPLFEKVGRIFQLRLMMHFSGASRGYCFVKFYTAEEASRAIEQLQNYEIRPGKRIGVLRSIDNCHLLLEGLSISLSGNEIRSEIAKVTEGMVGLTLQPSQKRLVDQKGRIRYFNRAVVEFESHRAASMARRHFFQEPLILHGYPVTVAWWNPPVKIRRRR